MSERYIVLFPQCRNETPTTFDATDAIKEWENVPEEEKKLFSYSQYRPYVRKFPQYLPDTVQLHGRKGYLRYKGVWYMYKSACSSRQTPPWMLVGSIAKKLPPFVMQLYIDACGGGLPQLLLDPDPVTRSAAEKFYKRYKNG